MISKVRRFQQNCFGHLRAPASAPVTSLFECSAFRIKRPSLRIVCSTFRRDARFCGAVSVARVSLPAWIEMGEGHRWCVDSP
jgi:hypothetical protein